MISSTTRIQLISNPLAVPGTTPVGYLDVAEEVQVPVTYSVADIKDISKRAGTFSKTIKLPGTKNNNTLLGQLYEVNLTTGTFDINKLQHCNILQNNIPVVENAYLQVVKVNKLQKGPNEDEHVEYEVLVKDTASDFFTKLGSRELVDIDFGDLNHSFLGSTIVTSFSHNAFSVPYKYVAPWVAPPAPGSAMYTMNDFKPAIYAQTYWERIHNDAGYSYQWQTAFSPFVNFDKLLIPYTGDDKKITAAANQANAVIATGPAQTTIPFAIAQMNSAITPLYTPLVINTEIQDPFNLYTPATSTYTVSTPVASPDAIDFIFDVTFDFTVNNPYTNPMTLGNPDSSYRAEIAVLNANTNAVLGIAPLTPYTQPYPAGSQPSGAGNGQILNPGVNVLQPTATTQVAVSITNLTSGTPIKFRIQIEPNAAGQVVRYYNPVLGGFGSFIPAVNMSAVQLTVKYNTEALVYGSTVFMNEYVPSRIKQSDFIKSICMMYNLYVEQDPNQQNLLIYRHRDDFYDSGVVVDWTEKLDRESTQTLQFLPELHKKRLILTYKEDNDDYNVAYTESTKEIYGQQEIIFENEYIKDVETKELIFSPTPVRPITSLGVVAPLISGQNPDMNIRILMDNGMVTTSTSYDILEYPGSLFATTDFPFCSHMNAATNPSFDINFGICDYYFYDIVNTTNSNLYNLYWRRTMGQINSGKMMTANFWLNPVDIQKMKLNDKIRIDNSYWNINRIIDYNANTRQLTRVELISIDDAVQMPRFGKESIVKPTWYDNVNPAPQDTVAPVRPPKKIIEATNNKTKSANIASSTINSDRTIEIMGRRGVLGSDFTGVVIGDDQVANQPGFVVQGWAFNGSGVQITGITIVDPGADVAIPPDKVDPIDIIDGGLDVLRPYGGAPRTVTTRTYIDGGLDQV